MIISNVNIGSGPGFNDGESIYSAFYKVNQNFANVQSNVNSLTNSVSSVAGRTGNVTLTINDIVGLNTSYALNGNVTAANIGMKGYVDAKIAANVAALIDSAPGALDTLNELAAALNDDASFATTIVNTITFANTIQSQQIAAANLGMKGYVDSVASQSIYGNANVGSYLPTYGGNIKVSGITNNGNLLHIYSTLHIIGDASGNNGLFVGDPNVELVPYGNTIASFHGNVNAPVYLNIHNTNTGARSVAGIALTSDIGDTSNDSMIMIVAGSNYNDPLALPNVRPLDCVIDSTLGNLWIGTIAKTINFYSRNYSPGQANQIALVSIDDALTDGRGNLNIHRYVDLNFLDSNSKILFGDGSIQTTAYTGYGNSHVGAFTNLSNYAYNANVTAANLGMKGYVDSVASQSIYGNANVASYLHANDYRPYSNVNVAVFTNLSTYAYNANVTAANLGMKGYVDSLTYSNVQVDVHTNLSNYAYNANVTAANVGMKGYVDSITYADSDVQDYLGSLNTVSIGGGSNQGDRSVAIGSTAGGNQGMLAVAVGGGAAYQYQSANAVAIGSSAGALYQGNGAIAIGRVAGNYYQGKYAVSLGFYGNTTVEFGLDERQEYQGDYAIAIGYKAGTVWQPNSSIIINASTTPLNATANIAGLYINPVRQDDSNVANIVYYNTTTKEMTYGPAAGSSYSNVQVATYLPTHTGNVAAGNVKVSTAYRFETGNVTITNESGYVSLNPDTVYSGTAGVKIGGSGFILGPNGGRNLTLNYGSVTGAVGLQGNVTIGTVGSGNLFVLGNVIARDITGGNILATGTSGVVGFNGGGFVQQATSNATQVTSNTTSGNIQLMSIDIGAHAVHTVTFACNKLTTNDLLLIQHINGGLTSVYVDAYVVSDGLGIIWLRDITGNGTGAFTPMLKYAIIRAPSS